MLRLQTYHTLLAFIFQEWMLKIVPHSVTQAHLKVNINSRLAWNELCSQGSPQTYGSSSISTSKKLIFEGHITPSIASKGCSTPGSPSTWLRSLKPELLPPQPSSILSPFEHVTCNTIRNTSQVTSSPLTLSFPWHFPNRFLAKLDVAVHPCIHNTHKREARRTWVLKTVLTKPLRHQVPQYLTSNCI